MWFNSMQREEPYLGLTCIGRFPEMDFSFGTDTQVLHGRRQLVS